MSCKKWNNVCTLVTNCFCAHSSAVLVFISLVALQLPTWEINTKITLSWALKQFATRVQTLFCLYSILDVITIRDGIEVNPISKMDPCQFSNKWKHHITPWVMGFHCMLLYIPSTCYKGTGPSYSNNVFLCTLSYWVIYCIVTCLLGLMLLRYPF